VNWTDLHTSAHPKKGASFLDAYVTCGSVSKACDISGTPRSVHYWRLSHMANYREAFAAARRAACQYAVAKAKRRAVKFRNNRRLGQNPTKPDTLKRL
jgi:hypothetical protein